VSDGRERLTPRARRILAIAEDEAGALRQAEIGTEHLLLGLLREGRGLAARAFRDLGVEPDQLGQRIRARLPIADVGSDEAVVLGPAALDSIEMARAEARRLHHDYVGTEHLLLGLLRHGEGPAFVALAGIGVTLERARRKIVELINEAAAEAPTDLPADVGAFPSRRLYPERDVPANDTGLCARCSRPRQADWRFCPFCGERCPACEHCQTPLPTLAGVRFCPGCGAMVASDEGG
jgi:ATP-dependent Clp protease ATP-binding subunit ClpA